MSFWALMTESRCAPACWIRGSLVPRYFFNVVDGRFLPDLEGTPMSGLDAAKDEAVRTAGEMLRDLRNWGGSEWQMHVSDESGTTLIKLTFSAKVIAAE
jgi:hypothetical protein